MELYLDAASNLRARQVLNRPRRLIPLRLLASGRPRRIGWEGAARGLGVDPAPQSGPQPPPHEGGRFVAVGRNREFPSTDFWRTGRDGLLFAFHLHSFAGLAAYSAGERTAEADAFWVAVVDDWLLALRRAGTAGVAPVPDEWPRDRLVCGALGRRLARRPRPAE